jgi:hypothetical protein
MNPTKTAYLFRLHMICKEMLNHPFSQIQTREYSHIRTLLSIGYNTGLHFSLKQCDEIRLKSTLP